MLPFPLERDQALAHAAFAAVALRGILPYRRPCESGGASSIGALASAT